MDLKGFPGPISWGYFLVILYIVENICAKFQLDINFFWVKTLNGWTIYVLDFSGCIERNRDVNIYQNINLVY